MGKKPAKRCVKEVIIVLKWEIFSWWGGDMVFGLKVRYLEKVKTLR
jgi:hypothetical protein